MNVQPSVSTVHIPVLSSEVVSSLLNGRCRETPMVVVDCTLGGGGHAELLLNEHEQLFLYGLDRDPAAVNRTTKRLRRFKERTQFVVRGFDSLGELSSEILASASNCFGHEVLGVDGIFADLGLSSDQLNCAERGFSFQMTGPLDMRMSPDSELTASDVLNSYSFLQLVRMMRRGGMRSHVRSLVNAIIESRPLNDTLEFAALCERVFRISNLKHGKRRSHPATIPFQAVRIEVNKELEAIEALLPASLSLLSSGGRLAVICFHSLEDKLIAQTMRRWARPGFVPVGLPVAGTASFGKLLTKQAITPSEIEAKNNSRARSSRLRVFQKDGVGGNDVG